MAKKTVRVAALLATLAMTAAALVPAVSAAAASAPDADPGIPYTPPTTQKTPYTADTSAPGSNEIAPTRRVDIATSKDGNYLQYRIPAMIVTNDGTIVTSYDGRATTADLPSHIDNLVRISHDGGTTWGDQIVARTGPYPAGYGDPALGYNPDTNRIFRFYTGSVNTGFASGHAGTAADDPDVLQNWVSYSDDDGKTWTNHDITPQSKDASWLGMFASSGTATYIQNGPHAGRLVEIYDVRTPQGTGDVAVWTDDNGATWQHGQPGALGLGNEAKTAVTSQGDLLLSLRGNGHRITALSTDGGATWGEPTSNPQLIDPNDNGSILRVYPTAPASDPRSKIMLETNNDDPSIRMDTVVKMSCDDGLTWPISKLLQPGSSGYSTAVMLDDHTVGVLYERAGYKNITFESFPLSALGGVCAPIALPASVSLTTGGTTTVPVTVSNQQADALPAGSVAVSGDHGITGSADVPAIAAGSSVTVDLPVTVDADAPAASAPITVTYTEDGAHSGLQSTVQIVRGGTTVTAIHDTATHTFDGSHLLDKTDSLPSIAGAAGGSISVTFATTSRAAVETLFGVTEKSLHDYDMLLTLNDGHPYFEMRAGSSTYITKFTSSIDVADGATHTLTLTATGGTTSLSLDGTVIDSQSSQHFLADMPDADTVTVGGGTFAPTNSTTPADQWFFTGTISDVTVTVLKGTSTPTPKPAVRIEPVLDVYHYSDSHGLGVGDAGAYKVRVTNTGNVALSGFSSVTDDPSDLDLGSCLGGTLNPGASVVCNATHTFTGADVDARGYTPTVSLDATAAGAAFHAAVTGAEVPLPAPYTLPSAPAAASAPAPGCSPTPITPVAAVANTEESFANHGAEDTPAANAIDGKPGTFWSSGWSVGTQEFPNWIIVDLGAATDVCAITYTPRQNNTNGNIGDWRAYVSNNPNDFGTPVAGGSFVSGNATQTAYLPQPVKGRYLKLAAYDDIGAAHTQTTTIAELAVQAVDPDYVAPTGTPALIPEPDSVTPGTGPSFLLSPTTAIVTDDATAKIGAQLAADLKPATGYDLDVTGAAPAGANSIRLAVAKDAGSGDEAYTLKVTGDGVTIEGTTPEAVFDGVQTLLQLLPEAIRSTSVQHGEWTIAPVSITDHPRFAYRGGMLDVARRFYPVDQVERFIDYLAEYKFNALHLHLTEDQGWRIAISAYPKLTEVGASVQSGIPAGTDDNGVTGPWFYTKAQYKQIVDYAAARYIQVVPEIDGPGHAGAAMSAVPDLNCDDTAIPPWMSFGRGPHFCLDAQHIGNVATFLTNVMEDLAGQTPGEFIHVGGDEAAGITAQQYTDYTDIANTAVTATGKKVMAWNSWEDGAGLPAGGVLENYAQTSGDPALAPDVQKALDAGNKILMAPADRAYLDIKYDPSVPFGLTWINGGYIDLARAYQWDPDTAVPDGKGGAVPITDGRIFGVEFGLWADDTNQHGEVPWTADAPFAPVSTYMDTMLFPRMPAIAEIAWSKKEDRAGDQGLLDDFEARLVNQAQGWDAAGIDYHRASDVRWKATGAPALPTASDVTVGAPHAAVTVDDHGAAHLTVTGTVSGDVTSIAVTIDGTVHTVSAAGDYSLDVPAEPGVNHVSVRVVDANGAQAGAARTASASLGTLTVTEHGDGWRVTGAHLAPATPVTLTLHSAALAVGTARTDADGAFTADVAVPAAATPGAHHLVATAGTSAAVAAVSVAAPADTGSTGGSGDNGGSSAGGSGSGSGAAGSGTGSATGGTGSTGTGSAGSGGASSAAVSGGAYASATGTDAGTGSAGHGGPLARTGSDTAAAILAAALLLALGALAALGAAARARKNRLTRGGHH